MSVTNIGKESNVASNDERLTEEEQKKLLMATIGHGNLQTAAGLAKVCAPILRSARQGNRHLPETIEKIRDFLNIKS